MIILHSLPTYLILFCSFFIDNLACIWCCIVLCFGHVLHHRPRWIYWTFVGTVADLVAEALVTRRALVGHHSSVYAAVH